MASNQKEHSSSSGHGDPRSLEGKPLYASEAYSLKPGRYVRMEAALWAGRWWWILAIALLTLLILGFKVTAAFYYVALMLVFIIIPSLMMFFYFANLLGEASRIALAKKKLKIGAQGITVEFSPIPAEDGSAPRRLPERQLSWKEIKTVRTTANSLMFHLEEGRYKILPLPFAAIPAGTDPQEILEYALSCIGDK